MKIIFSILSIIFVASIFASTTPDWSREFNLPLGQTRENIYSLNEQEFLDIKQKGIKHALVYPVEVSGLFIPYDPMINFFKSENSDLIEFILKLIKKDVSDITSEEGLYQWLGLNKYNDESATGIYRIPYPDGHRPHYYMGASIVETKNGKGLTFSCATCHSASIFGTSIMGLTNKTVKANRLFHMAKQFVPFVPNGMFKRATGATDEEVEMLKRTKKNLHAVGATNPQVLGLDTSLPQVALSLSRRAKDENASKSPFYEAFPRANELDHAIADSKPAVWWNLKYKTRWLSDGSIVAGNPIYTNFLWNELGRGTELRELEGWMRDNQDTIKELTAAAFSSEAPRWTDFFDVKSINIEMAKRGESLFNDTCKKCHGEYVKAWSQEDSENLSDVEKLETIKVFYHEQTPVKDVGTDPGRYLGTKAFADELNRLKISKMMKTIVEPQVGYVPPPLVGVWARFPYLHNNAVPSLCQLMTPPEQRVKTFYQIPTERRGVDFDEECVGFPIGDKIPKDRKIKEAFFDTSKEGLKNIGHYKMFLNENGTEKFSKNEKADLLMFLKTL